MSDDSLHLTRGEIPADDWSPAREEAFALRAGEILRPMFEGLKAQLPPGIDFAIAIDVPAVLHGKEGRVIVVSTDRRRMAHALATWITQSDVLSGGGR